MDQELNAKLIDFGCSRYIPTSRSDYFDEFNGTPAYIPPECIRRERHRGPEVDIWCLGVLLYVMSFSTRPFRNHEEILSGRYRTPRYPRTRALMSLIDSLLVVNPAKRPLAEKILEHPWFDPHLRHVLIPVTSTTI